MDLGLHVADFTWSGGPGALGPALAAHARNAEQAGIARITVMDHFWQLPGIGPESNDMLEAYTALGFLAAHTSTVQLHTLVTGVIYREPALLAKAVTTLDVLSGGRAGLGIGAAWNDSESAGLGFTFPGAKERLDRMEEAVRICLQMWSDSEEPFDGEHYHLGRTLNSPQPLQRPHPPLMIGGSGEKRTLKLVAQYADACNIAASPEAGHKLEVLRRHCDDAGRDEAQVEKTTMVALKPDTSRDDLLRDLLEMRDLGFTVGYVYAVGLEPGPIVETLASVLPEL